MQNDPYTSWETLVAPHLAAFIEAGGTWAALPALAEPRRTMIVLEKLEQEMYNGGFVQFFANWGYDTLLLALQALEQIGALQARELLQACYRVIARLEDEDIQDLWDIPRHLTEQERGRLQWLTQRYRQDPDRICERALAIYSQ